MHYFFGKEFQLLSQSAFSQTVILMRINITYCDICLFLAEYFLNARTNICPNDELKGVGGKFNILNETNHAFVKLLCSIFKVKKAQIKIWSCQKIIKRSKKMFIKSILRCFFSFGWKELLAHVTFHVTEIDLKKNL